MSHARAPDVRRLTSNAWAAYVTRRRPTRTTRREYRHFLNIPHSSAREAGYLIDLSARLGFLERAPVLALVNAYEPLAAGLLSLMAATERDAAVGERPGQTS